MKNERMTLVCGSSNDYVMPMTVMLFSALSNMSKDEPVDLYIFDHGIRAASRSKLEACLRQTSSHFYVHWCKPDHPFLSKVKTHAISPAVFDRFVLTKVLPSTLRRAIFLDSDLIVQGDLRELWAEDFENRAVLAVQDFQLPTFGRRFGDNLPAGIDPSTPYINGGVLVCNLDFWRREGVEERLIANLLAHYSSYNWPDQDAMNAVVYDCAKLLHPAWNVLVNPVRHKSGPSQTRLVCEAVRLELSGWEAAKIIHFAGRFKPWWTMRHRGSHGGACRQYYGAAKAAGWYGTFSYWVWMNRLRADLLKRQLSKIKSLYKFPRV